MDTFSDVPSGTLGHAVDELSGDNSEEARALRDQLFTAMVRTEAMLRVADRLDVLADELEELRLRIWRLMQNHVSDL
jgi:superfamily I DNA and RNA helicase